MTDKTEAQAPPPGGSQTDSAAEDSQSFRDRQHQVYCSDRAKYLFGSYRRDDANDPEVYAVSIAAILTDYPRAVVEYATDPRTGLAAKHKFPPNVAEVKEFCDEEMARIARMSGPRPPYHKRTYTPPPSHPGCFARLLVRTEAPQYAQVREVVDSGKADTRDWRHDEHGRGTWVSLSLWEKITSGQMRVWRNWKPPSDADLRARYGKEEAEANG